MGDPSTNMDAPSRRGMLAIVAAIGATTAIPAVAVSTWNAADWLTRWHALGCGARQDTRGHLQLTPLSGAEVQAGAMLAELASAGRLPAVSELLNHSGLYDSCPALIAVAAMHAIDAEYVSGDDDPEGETAWLDRWCAARRRLRYSPARTLKGLAAKLREGIEYIETPDGDAIIADALAQLERWA